jgi:cytochrome c
MDALVAELADTLGERWVVDEGTLHMTGRRSGEDGWQTPDAGDLMLTSEPLENYELYLEWKLQEGGNSGIIYNVNEDPTLPRPYMSGLEYQLLDNARHPDGQIVKHRAGDLYDLIESRFVAANPPGEWNRSRLVVDNGKIQHWLNGYKVVETEMWTPEWQELIERSKFRDWESFAKTPGGHIVLQDHGDKVWFRNIKLKQL